MNMLCLVRDLLAVKRKLKEIWIFRWTNLIIFACMTKHKKIKQTTQ